MLTGSGHFFDESLAILRGLGDCDVFLSKAAEEVLRMYKHRGEIFPPTTVVYRDTTASAAPVGQFYGGGKWGDGLPKDHRGCSKEGR